MKYSIIVAMLLSLVLATGCGKPGRHEIEVSGNVTLDGQPVEKGAVFFLPTGAGGSDGGGNIVDGKYTALVTLGEKLIRVRGSKYMGQVKNTDPAYSNETKASYKMITDPKLHEDGSTLKVEIKGRKMTLDLALESGKALGQ
ncbi:MAG: hypothetical protein Q4G68_10610 [Planctomycetia bacterium]|nr:hypothetical protein [Planctomycetia bacterium]